MASPSLSTAAIARKNIARCPWRSFCLVLTMMVFSFVLYAGTVMSVSLSRGARSAADRLGADIIVVPEGYDPHIDSIILSGRPTMFSLPRDVLQRLQGIEGIDRMSPQTFLATLRASCCSYPLQIVGIDYDSDFVVRPWLEATLRRALRDGELIVGSRVGGELGDTLHFFGVDLPIVGRLEQTGMAFDSTVFVTRKTAASLAKAAENIFKHPLTSDGSLVSTVMIRLKPGTDSVKMAQEINRRLGDEGIFALFSKKFVNSIASTLTMVSWFIGGGIALVWLLAVLLIALLFQVSMNERRGEIGVLRSIGASRGKILCLALTEALLVSLYGSALGTALGAAAVAGLGPLAVQTLKLPFLLPSWTALFLLAGAAVAASTLTGVLSALFSALRASRADVYDTLRGN